MAPADRTARSIASRIRNFVLASIAVAGLTGCNMYKLEELRHATPSGTPFQNELSRLYMDYASTAENRYDWFNSWHFADKGLMLAYGRDAGPEDLNDWDIPKAVRPDLEKAREALLAVLTPELMRSQPVKAAQAQFYFDCWVKEQEQNWRDEEIARCRDKMTVAMAEIHSATHPEPVATGEVREVKPKAAAAPSKPAKAKKPAVKAAEKPKAARKEPKKSGEAAAPRAAQEAMPESTSYAVFFETGKAEVSEPGMNVITEIVRSLRDIPDYSIIIHGGKDHPGMAAERIQVVKKLLVAGGVKESAIHIGTGKTEIESVQSPNYRVEIFLNE